jgi:anti-sigma-K factor RskA
VTPEELTRKAGEYVLGTLTVAERRAVEDERRSDPELDRRIRAWEARLVTLTDRLAPAEPSDAVWSRIVDDLDSGRAGGATEDQIVVRLVERARRWRNASLGLGALAAALVGFLVFDRTRVPSEPGGRYIAVINRSAEEPALIVRVDTATGSVSVRPVTAAAPPDRTLQLWYADRGEKPRSLGLLDQDGRPLRASLDFGRVTPEAHFAVSVEPPGGSPTGQPTGPVIYQGKMIRE